MKSILILISTTFLCACSALPLGGVDPGQGNFPFTSNFETTLSSQIHAETADSMSMSLVPAPIAISGGTPGSQSLLMTVNPADVANHGNRSELAVYHCANLGDTFYFGWDLALPLADPDTYQWQIAAQWYQLPDFERGETFDFWGAHPPITVVLVPGKIQLKANYGSEKLLAEVPFTKGQWHRIVVGIKFLNTTDGEIQAWLDSIPLSSSPFRTQTLWNRAGAYFKCGLYRGAVGQTQAPSTNSIYLDNLRISRILAEVQ